MPRGSSLPKKRPAAKAPGRPTPLSVGRTACPFTGEEIQFSKAGDMWIAHTSLWTSRPFDFRDSLVYMLSHNQGVAPDWPRPGVSVVRDANEPPEKHPVGPDI